MYRIKGPTPEVEVFSPATKQVLRKIRRVVDYLLGAATIGLLVWQISLVPEPAGSRWSSETAWQLAGGAFLLLAVWCIWKRPSFSFLLFIGSSVFWLTSCAYNVRWGFG